MTTRCSTWSLVLATSRAAISASSVTSPVRGAVPASGCDAHGQAVDGDEQLRRGAEQPVDGVAVARPERRLEAVQHAVAVDRAVVVTAISRAITAFVSPPAAHLVARRLDGVEVAVDGVTGSMRYPAAAGRGGCGAASVLGGAVDHGDPPTAVGRLAQRRPPARPSRRRRPARTAPTRRPSGAQPGAAVVVVDRPPAGAGTSSTGDAGGDPAPGDADAVAHEQHAVVAGDVVEVEARPWRASARRVTARISGCR